MISAAIDATLECDECGRDYFNDPGGDEHQSEDISETDEEELKAHAEDRGWVFEDDPDNEFEPIVLCPSCARAKKAKGGVK